MSTTNTTTTTTTSPSTLSVESLVETEVKTASIEPASKASSPTRAVHCCDAIQWLNQAEDEG
jgi:hypothetical protein